ncbi:MAG: HD domain-containing protein [Clostridia bacterium]|nr:HD domain-containing protein [Clostridia bacterium]
MSIEILKNNNGAMEVCSLIESYGHRAYCVGGCVRDALMGKEPSDIDITSSASPDLVAEIFSDRGCRVVLSGVSHGTVTVIYKGKSYEITTMRRDGEYRDCRHPERVTYVDDIEVDLSRRDFTINAMAYSYSEDKIYDRFGGIEDILSGTIRCVGVAAVRFSEDALRILRALRFASVLGFRIEPDTKNALIKSAEMIGGLSRERIKHELDRLLLGNHAGDVIYEYSDVLSYVIAEIAQCKGFLQHSKYHSYDVLGHICKAVDATPPFLHLRYAALLHDISKPQTFSLDENGEGHFYGHAKKSAEIADRVTRELRFDANTRDAVLRLVSHHDTPLPTEHRLIKRRVSSLGAETFSDLIRLCRADCLAQSSIVRYRLDIYDEIENRFNEIIDSKECFDRTSLKVNGKDIIELGVNAGKNVGVVLSYLLGEVIDGRLENERESLMAEAEKYIELESLWS